MRYPIVIEPGDKDHAFGVVVPDLPGCFSAGDTLDEAFENAKEAISLWIESEISIPQPSDLEKIAKIPDFKGWYLGLVEVDMSSVPDKTERINICLPARVLRRLDKQANIAGESRSGYVAQLVLQHAV